MNRGREARVGFQSAFTLIEISIVVVIIGLIVGGILVGRDLIRVAEIRATVAQVEQFNTAANAFRTKYGCLAGDCAAAVEFGFDPTSAGDGNGVVGTCSRLSAGCYVAPPTYYATAGVHEYVDFWYHLSAAGMIPHAFAPYAQVFSAPDEDIRTAGIMTPATKLRPFGAASYGWVVRGPTTVFPGTTLGVGGPHFGVSTFPAHTLMLSNRAVSWVFPDRNGAFPPADMQAIDNKIDDGLPLTGQIQELGDGDVMNVSYDAVLYYQYVHNSCGPAVRYCVCASGGYPANPAQYNVRYSGAAVGLPALVGGCVIVVKASF